MIAGIASALQFSAALPGAPLLASAADDVVLVAAVIAAAAGIAVAISVIAPRLGRGRGREEGIAPGGVERRTIRPSPAGLADDPIVAALGLGDDEALRARRRRRPIGGSLNSPPGDSPPPT